MTPPNTWDLPVVVLSSLSVSPQELTCTRHHREMTGPMHFSLLAISANHCSTMNNNPTTINVHRSSDVVLLNHLSLTKETQMKSESINRKRLSRLNHLKHGSGPARGPLKSRDMSINPGKFLEIHHLLTKDDGNPHIISCRIARGALLAKAYHPSPDPSDHAASDDLDNPRLDTILAKHGHYPRTASNQDCCTGLKRLVHHGLKF